MSLKCTECGQIFNDGLNECPNCGCPASECEKVGNNHSNVHVGNEDLGNIHGSFNEKPQYSPFSPDNTLFKDPELLAQYPIGELEKRHPFWGWLLGPWYLTCKDENSREQYDVINNIFYACNILWKAVVYSTIWTFLKAWIAIVIFIVLSVILVSIDMGNVLLIVGLFIVGLFLYAYLFFLYIIGIGKSLHRYWPQFHKVWRKLCKRFVNAMKD